MKANPKVSFIGSDIHIEHLPLEKQHSMKTSNFYNDTEENPETL
jgi:hypothetical protein